MDFRAIGEYKTKLRAKASATVIEAGDLVAIASGLIIKATATSTRLGFCPSGAAAGETTIEVTIGQVDLKGDASDVFAVAHRGLEYDIAVSGGGVQTINQSGTTYKVLQMDSSDDAGVVASASDVKVRIIRPLESSLSTVI